MIKLNKKLRIGEFGRVLVRFGSAQIVSNFLRLISGFIVVRAIDPEMYGEFIGVGVYMGYVLLGQGGILNGLSRELPFEFGRKNDLYAKNLAYSSFFLSILLSLLTALAFLIIGLYQLYFGHLIVGLVYLSYTAIGGFQLLNTQFLPRLYFRNKDFDSLSNQNIKIAVGTFLTVPLVYFFGIYGLLLRGFVLAIYQFGLLFYNKPFKLQFTFKLRHFKTLLKTGFPIFLVGQINPLWTTVINTYIFSVGGALNMGLFALSGIVQRAIGVIPAAFSSVIYPRMTIMLGEGKSIKAILKANVRPLFFQFGVMLLLAIVGAILMPPAVDFLLPKYAGGVKAAQWMIFIPLAQSFGALNNIYNVVKKQFLFFVSLITGAIVGSFFIYFQVYQHGFYLEFFPQGMLLGNVVQQILSLVFISLLIKNE